jgi:superfamily II DNA/RNA helicase
VAQLHRSLVRHGFSAVALHGDMDQPARMAALDQFRRGEITLLIASDVAARGLDIPAVSHVFNFDVPHHADDYVHRIGRTGRAGRSGTAITVVSPADKKSVAAIERLIGQTIGWMSTPPTSTDAPGPAPSAQRKPAPSAQRKPSPQRKVLRNGHDPRRHRDRAPAAPVPRVDEPRPRVAAAAPVRQPDQAAGGHLPAFLLRPVRIKA